MTTPERGVIPFGRSTIRYTVERRARRRTVTIAVDARDGVIVQAPHEITPDAIGAVVRRKAPWIMRRLADFAELPAPPAPKEFINGEGFLYLGRSYRLKCLQPPNCDGPAVKLYAGRLYVAFPPCMGPPEAGGHIREAIIAWYKARARKRLPERVALFAERLGGRPPPVYIRDQKKRWGSCSRDGDLRFNWRIIMAPLPLVDYVIAHEVCHLRLKNHSAAFWRLLRRLMPDYEQRRERLRTAGPQFQL